MVEAVLGKWQVDLDSTTGLEEFGAAIGELIISQGKVDMK